MIRLSSLLTLVLLSCGCAATVNTDGNSESALGSAARRDPATADAVPGLPSEKQIHELFQDRIGVRDFTIPSPDWKVESEWQRIAFWWATGHGDELTAVTASTVQILVLYSTTNDQDTDLRGLEMSPSPNNLPHIHVSTKLEGTRNEFTYYSLSGATKYQEHCRQETGQFYMACRVIAKHPNGSTDVNYQLLRPKNSESPLPTMPTTDGILQLFRDNVGIRNFDLPGSTDWFPQSRWHRIAFWWANGSMEELSPSEAPTIKILTIFSDQMNGPINFRVLEVAQQSHELPSVNVSAKMNGDLSDFIYFNVTEDTKYLEQCRGGSDGRSLVCRVIIKDPSGDTRINYQLFEALP